MKEGPREPFVPNARRGESQVGQGKRSQLTLTDCRSRVTFTATLEEVLLLFSSYR